MWKFIIILRIEKKRKMDALRKKRYKDKINYILDSFKLIDNMPKNELEKRGIF